MSNAPSNSSGGDSINEKIVGSLADDVNWKTWRRLAIEAQERFHEALIANSPQFPGLVDYAVVELAREANGTPAWSWSAAAEIQETINSVNAWGTRLHDWASWNQVVDSYEDEEQKWEVLHHFVEPLAFFCMLQPSSVSDRLMLVSETLLHQANCRVFSDYPDSLDQDDLKPWQGLRRSDRKKQVSRLGKSWKRFNKFRTALDELNGIEYQKLSRNFRDLSVHSFAPRFMTGQILRAPRAIVPWQEMVKQPCGGYLPIDHPNKKGVQYEMVALEPFPLGLACSTNFVEYEKTLAAMSEFSKLVGEMCARINGLVRGK
ncbi:MAG: hypothetical protein ACN6O6_19790 [Pseudomonas sp.]|uniref:hypothetical protein n=1 Tax=Pseudomonas sp. TaxID=306 RepID=UPI003D1040EE